MACYHPIEAFRTKGGDVTFKRGQGVGFTLRLPCGRCIGCRIDRSRQWAVRCVHEASLHRANSYITLTYNDDHLPTGRTLVKTDFTSWIKKFREEIRSKQPKLRYYMCGEYGDQLGRPHFHALLFGYDFPDKRKHDEQNGNVLFTSKQLTKSWGKGFCTIGNVTFQSAAYVARYVMKKVGGDPAQAHYLHIDEFTGECTNRIPEYTNMSLKPGIGSKWFDKYNKEVYPDDFVIIAGKKYKTPKYYDRLFKRLQGEHALEIVQNKRLKIARSRAEHNTPEKLKVREFIQEQKFKQLKRTLT